MNATRTSPAQPVQRPDEPTDDPATHACTYCGAETRGDIGRMTLWLGDRLVVIRDVPARVCPGCGETFYEGDILARIERLQAGGARDAVPVDTIEADVYAWEGLR